MENKILTISKKDAINLALSQYVGNQCTICGKSFDSIESLDDAVWYLTENGRIAHKECYNQKMKENQDATSL